MSDSSESLIGKTFAGRFAIERLLGEGAMGRVYRARHVNLDKIVAIKVLHPEIGRDAQVVERFQREARAASRLEHPHSLQVLDFGKDEENGLFISMEYLDGKDVEKVIRESGPMAPARVIAIMSQVLSALGAAQDLGIVHRDMKPGNVMLIEKSVDDVLVRDFVKVCDFGLAKVANPEDRSQAELTKTGTVFGTPSYMSPEQARGDKTDSRTDLYACGVILFKMLTGEVPFVAETIVGTLMKHIADPVPPFESMGRPADAELEAVIRKAMAKDRAERYGHAREMRADLLTIAGRRGYKIEGADPRPGIELIAQAAPATQPEFGLSKTLVPASAPPIERTMSSIGTASIAPVAARSMGSMLPGLLGLVFVGSIAGVLYFKRDRVDEVFVPLAIPDARVVETAADAAVLQPLPDAGFMDAAAILDATVEPDTGSKLIDKPLEKGRDAGAARDAIPALEVMIPDASAPDAVVAPEPEVKVEPPPPPPDAGVLERERPGLPVLPTKPGLVEGFEVSLEVVDLSVTGGVSKRRIEMGFERSYEEIKVCLRKELGKVGREVTGSLGIKAKIDPSGRLVDISIESKLPAADDCVKSSMVAARMPKPDTGTVGINLRLRYSAKNPG